MGNSRPASYSALLESLDSSFKFSYLRFSPLTRAGNVQKFFEHSLEKVKGTSYAPKDHKKMIFFIDDVNLNKKEAYGAHPSLELMRQYLEHQGWYNLDTNTMMKVSNASFFCSANPNRGCKDAFSNRFKRHFNILAPVSASEEELSTMFSTVLASRLASHNPTLQKFRG